MNNERGMPQVPTQMHVPAYTIPTDLVDLPSQGKFYPPNHPLHSSETVEVRYMSTKEEDILLNQTFLEKGIMIDRLIGSLLVDKKINVNTLLVGDKNAIVINARKNAYGPDYVFIYKCANCFDDNECTVNLDALEHRGSQGTNFTEKGTFLIDLPVSKVTIEVGLLTTSDEVEINKKIQQKEKHGLVAEPMVERYRRMIRSVNGDPNPVGIAHFVTNMPIRDSRFLTAQYLAANPDIDFVYEHNCTKCEHANKGGVPLTGAFFWPDE